MDRALASGVDKSLVSTYRIMLYKPFLRQKMIAEIVQTATRGRT